MYFNVAGLTYIRNWTRLTKECYSINCMCDYCTFVPEDLKEKCRVKTYVVATYKKFGKPKENDDGRQI